jgi:NitT/TauT family transport system permease protein
MIGVVRPATFTRPLPGPGLPPYVVQAASLLIGLLLWEVVFGYVLDIKFIPPLSEVMARWVEIWNSGDLPQAVADSLATLIVGYVLSVVMGVVVGVAMVYSEKFSQMIGPYISALIVLPGIVLGPVFFILFGLGSETLIAIIVVMSFPFVVLNTVTAFTEIPREPREMARMLGANRLEVFWLVTLREAMPLLVAGLRIGMGRAIKGMFVGQLVVVVVGLGYLGLLYQGAFDAAGALAIGFTIILISVVGLGLVQIVDRRLNWWVGK